MRKQSYFFLLPAIFLFACATSRQSRKPSESIPAEELRRDFSIFRGVLEESHPSLYWYTSKDSMDRYFNNAYAQIKDSMTEPAFRTLLAYVITQIDCGHTAVKYSKGYLKYLDTARLRSFPLALRFWKDTMVITANLNRRDSILKRGTVVRSIEGYTQPQLADTLFKFIVTDGYSLSGKYQTLSTGFSFANLYKQVFGLKDSFRIEYVDTLGNVQTRWSRVYEFRNDTMGRTGLTVRPPPGKTKPRPEVYFFSNTSLQLDTVSKIAYMRLNTFDRGNHLRHFFHRSFRKLKENKIRHLVIDVEANGGGDAGNSSALTRYLIDHRFKLADSLYAIRRGSEYSKYIGKSRLYQMMTWFISSKRADGYYHFGYFERHHYHPRKKNHFNGDVYILIGGNSFSATTLFAGALKGQKNITLVGEETGGGYYGHTAWIIEEVTLPNSKIRFTLPKFHLVIDKNRTKDGRGIMPDVWAFPSPESIRMRVDSKAVMARELIEEKSKGNSQ